MVQCPIRPRLRRLPLPASHRPGSVPTNNIRDPTTRMPVAIPAAMTATYPFFGGGGGDGGTGGNDLRVSDPSTAILPVASSPKASGCMASCFSYGPERLVTTLGLDPQAEATLLSPSSPSRRCATGARAAQRACGAVSLGALALVRARPRPTEGQRGAAPMCSDSHVRMRWQTPCLSLLGESR